MCIVVVVVIVATLVLSKIKIQSIAHLIIIIKYSIGCFRPTLRKLEPHSMYEIWVRIGEEWSSWQLGDETTVLSSFLSLCLLTGG